MCVCFCLCVCEWLTEWIIHQLLKGTNWAGITRRLTGGAVSNMLWHVTPRPASVHVRMYRFASVSPLLLNVVFCSIKHRGSDSELRDLIIPNTKHTECHLFKLVWDFFFKEKNTKQNIFCFHFIRPESKGLWRWNRTPACVVWNQQKQTSHPNNYCFFQYVIFPGETRTRSPSCAARRWVKAASVSSDLCPARLDSPSSSRPRTTSPYCVFPKLDLADSFRRLASVCPGAADRISGQSSCLSDHTEGLWTTAVNMFPHSCLALTLGTRAFVLACVCLPAIKSNRCQ